jgi:hypothetical protein
LPAPRSFAFSRGRRAFRAWATFSGIVIVAIGAGSLSKHAMGWDLGLDWAALHSWLGNGVTGIVAVPSAIAYLLMGVAVLAYPTPSARGIGKRVRVLLFTIGSLGVLGIAAHVVSARLLFPSTPSRACPR